MSDQNERLRQHPEDRFHPPQLQIDLEKVAATLLAEPLPANRKHRQETLYRRHPITVALFLFKVGAQLSPTWLRASSRFMSWKDISRCSSRVKTAASVRARF